MPLQPFPERGFQSFHDLVHLLLAAEFAEDDVQRADRDDDPLPEEIDAGEDREPAPPVELAEENCRRIDRTQGHHDPFPEQ